MDSNLWVLAGLAASVSTVVVFSAIGLSRLRQLRQRKRKFQSKDRIEVALTAVAAIDAAAESLKKVIEAVPGSNTAFTGRSAAVAIDTAARAILSILADLPVRMLAAETAIHGLDDEQKTMRELFNRLGK